MRHGNNARPTRRGEATTATGASLECQGTAPGRSPGSGQTPAGVVHASSTVPVPNQTKGAVGEGWATPPDATGRSHHGNHRIARAAANGKRMSNDPVGAFATSTGWARPDYPRCFVDHWRPHIAVTSQRGWLGTMCHPGGSRRTVVGIELAAVCSGRDSVVARYRLSRSPGAVSPGTPRRLRGLLACPAAAGSLRSRPRSPSSGAPGPHS